MPPCQLLIPSLCRRFGFGKASTVDNPPKRLATMLGVPFGQEHVIQARPLAPGTVMPWNRSGNGKLFFPVAVPLCVVAMVVPLKIFPSAGSSRVNVQRFFCWILNFHAILCSWQSSESKEIPKLPKRGELPGLPGTIKTKDVRVVAEHKNNQK